MQNKQIAAALRITPEKAARWRNRLLDGGLAALEKDAPCPGRRPTISPEKILRCKSSCASRTSSRCRARARSTSRATGSARTRWPRSAAWQGRFRERVYENPASLPGKKP